MNAANLTKLLDELEWACFADGNIGAKDRRRLARDAVNRALLEGAPEPQKYDDVLAPFLELMRRELHANSHKGDRAGWLKMTRDEATLEVYHHAAKAAEALRDADMVALREHSADVANTAMMLLDVCGQLAKPEAPAKATCNYPDCTCPFDAPGDPNWCARGLPKADPCAGCAPGRICKKPTCGRLGGAS